MGRRFVVGVAVCAVGSSFTTRVEAQLLRFTGELHAGLTIPAGAFADDPAVRGIGGDATYGVRIDVRPFDWGGLTLGFSQHRYGCDACPSGDRPVSTGWEIGGRIGPPSDRVQPWVSGAVVFHTVEAELPGGPAGGDASDTGVGGELGFGVDVVVARRVRLRPQARYLWFDARFDEAGLLRVRHWTAELGFVLGL